MRIFAHWLLQGGGYNAILRGLNAMGRKADISGKGAAFSEWPSGLLAEVLSSPSTLVGRMKLYSINDPSAYSIFLFDFRIHLALSRRR